MTSAYLRALKTSLTGDPRTPLVFVCNFEVEQSWSRGFVGLPAAPFSMTGPLVTRMEELGALLAGPDDFLILQHPLDPAYVRYVGELGLTLPTVLLADGPAAPALSRESAGESTAARAMNSPALLAILRDLAARGARLMPMGVSEEEVRLAEAAGMPLAAPDLDTVIAVNSKIYSRRLVEASGLRAVPGWCCETVPEFTELMTALPEFPVVVKDAYGVSGKGLVLVEDQRTAERLIRQVTRRAARRGDDRLHVVVERWLPKRANLNYQLTVDASGEIRLDFVKEALTEGGVHLGHLSPARLDVHQLAEIEKAAQTVGQALHRDGFWGVAGVDAVVATDEVIYPVLEINARFNMSTYQGAVLEAFEHPASLARRHVLRLSAPLDFSAVRDALPSAGDLVITCFGTVNAMAGDAAPFEGRLYTLALGPDREAVTALADAASKALEHLAEGAR